MPTAARRAAPQNALYLLFVLAQRDRARNGVDAARRLRKEKDTGHVQQRQMRVWRGNRAARCGSAPCDSSENEIRILK
jgi:hypothetical protein